MKLKYLVLSASRVGLRLLLAQSVLGAGMTWGATTAPAGAVVGWWKFDDATNPGLDSSEYGNDLDGLGNVSAGIVDSGYTTKGTYDDSGCLYIGTAGNTATATPKKIWDTTKGYTYMVRIRGEIKDISTTWLTGSDLQLVKKLNDEKGWHLISMRYDPDRVTGSSSSRHKYWLFGDDATATDRGESSSDSIDSVYFPLSNEIAIGGMVGASSRSAEYKGCMDDIIVVCRTMTKKEITRYYLTADPNPYLVADSGTAFYQSAGWSCSDYEAIGYAPSDLPGADFVVDDGRVLTVASEGVFGGHSLALGHLAPLTSRLDGSQIASANGNLNQQASVTIPDLRLNCGKITGAPGKSLMATKLTVNATAENRFEISVASETYAISGAATGGGWIEKTGAGTLDLSGLKGDYRVKVTAGNVIYPDDYDYGAKPMLIWQ